MIGKSPSTAPTQVPRDTPQIIHAKSSEIRVGDIVLTHGMRIRIDETHTYNSTGSNRDEYPIVYVHLGTVLNVAEVHEARFIPPVVPVQRGPPRAWAGAPGGREDTWTVQGNDLATWTVERVLAGDASE